MTLATTRIAIAGLAVAAFPGCGRDPGPSGRRNAADDLRSRTWCERVLAPIAAPYVGSYPLSVGNVVAYGELSCEWVEPGATADDVLLGSKPGVLVDVICLPGITAPDKLAIASANYEPSHPEHLPAPGKLALRWPPMQLDFWASNADCAVWIQWHVAAAGLDPFAAALDRTLTPTTIIGITPTWR